MFALCNFMSEYKSIKIKHEKQTKHRKGGILKIRRDCFQFDLNRRMI